ncbi:MAG TPA: hypothetical protein VL400_25350 [Polyangiaceae bacterium]|nr:hypothetical protein [Polyangiaceae bacterium]
MIAVLARSMRRSAGFVCVLATTSALAACGATTADSVRCPAGSQWDGSACIATVVRVQCPEGTTLRGEVCSPPVVYDCTPGSHRVPDGGCAPDVERAASAPVDIASPPASGAPPSPSSMTVDSGTKTDQRKLGEGCNCPSGDAFCIVQCERKKQPPTPPTEPFDRSAAAASLSASATAAKQCPRPPELPAKTNVRLVFSTNGEVRSVSFEPPYTGTATAKCIAAVFMKSKIPPFTGTDVTVSKPLSL